MHIRFYYIATETLKKSIKYAVNVFESKERYELSFVFSINKVKLIIFL